MNLRKTSTFVGINQSYERKRDIKNKTLQSKFKSSAMSSSKAPYGSEIRNLMKSYNPHYDREDPFTNYQKFYEASEINDILEKYPDVNSIKIEKETCLVELGKLKDEYENLCRIFDQEFFDIQTNTREKELRNHISNLSERVFTRDVDRIKYNMNDLCGEISKNIDTIHIKVKNEITEKKKDIENRINIRIMDAEYKNKMVLESKVREQESKLRGLHSITNEMTKIKNNYEKITKKIEMLNYNNNQLSKKINEQKLISNNMKKDMMNIKIINKDLTKKLSINNGLNDNDLIILKNESFEKLRMKTENNIITTKKKTK